MSYIELKNVSKVFRTPIIEGGVINSVKSLFHRKYETHVAVDKVSFNINKGELVGYIGPNGAGKSTTIKMLAGILVPSSGEVLVDGRMPHENRRENAMHIGVVFGQRSQLHWDLPMDDTLRLYKKMYKVDDDKFRHNVEFFKELLEMQDFMHKPVRQLSLGQKMRAELAVALLHDPEILYLDEPTIGLDVVAKSRLRRLIKEINKEKNTTVILTTHDMDDIEQICKRIIMIDNGHILHDSSLDAFKEKYSGEHMIAVEFSDESATVDDKRLKVVKEEKYKKEILFNKSDISVKEAIIYFTQNYDIKDISIKEPEIEEIVRKYYEGNNKKAVGAGV